MSFILKVLFLLANSALWVCVCHLPSALAAEEQAETCPEETSTANSGSCKYSFPRSIRILCYGDSLTAGESPDDNEFYPYADTLRRDLTERELDVPVLVHHIGLCGWTTHDMLQVLDHPTQGLGHAIQQEQKEEELSIVVILAGTNDLWPQNLNPNHDNTESVTQQVVQNLIQLHRVAWEASPTTRTVAIGIPSSVYQERDNPAAKIARERINQELHKMTEEESYGKLQFLPFPFPYDPPSTNWSRDGTHFSESGYQALGQAVARYIVDNILPQLD